MKNKVLWSVLALLLVLSAGYLYQTVPNEAEVKVIEMINHDGSEAGAVHISETKSGVLLRLNLEGLTPDGEHAIHIHEVGACDTSAGFQTAGGHFNPHGHSHGLKHPEGHHAGDMPNIRPDHKGRVVNQLVLNRSVTLSMESTEKRTSIFDDDGSSIIIHAGADDHISQPSGAAGKRIMCGVIK